MKITATWKPTLADFSPHRSGKGKDVLVVDCSLDETVYDYFSSNYALVNAAAVVEMLEDELTYARAALWQELINERTPY